MKDPPVQIVAGKVEYVREGDETVAKFTETGPAKLGIKKVTIHAEQGGRFTVFLLTDDYPREMGGKLRVRVRDKLLTPNSWGGDEKASRSLGLRDVDAATAEILNGGPISKAPKESIKVEYLGLEKSFPLNGPVRVLIWLTNVGQTPLTIHWGTTGGGNYPCRDTQLSFKATLDGAAVATNPKPLPDGFIISPFVLKPNSALKRSEDLRQWIDFRKPGKYEVEVTYTIQIMNPGKDGTPSDWNVSYGDKFTVKMGE